PEDSDDEPRVRLRLRCPRRTVRLWRDVVDLARRMAGAELSDGAAAEAIAAEGLSARPAPTMSWPESQRPPEADPPDPAETHAAFASAVDWNAVAEAVPADVAALANVDDLDPVALDARLRAAVLAMQQIDRQMGRLLRIVFDRRLYTLMLFRSGAR